jgi:hypothetical protein
VLKQRDTDNVTDVRSLGTGLTVQYLLWKKNKIEKKEKEKRNDLSLKMYVYKFWLNFIPSETAKETNLQPTLMV